MEGKNGGFLQSNILLRQISQDPVLAEKKDVKYDTLTPNIIP